MYYREMSLFDSLGGSLLGLCVVAVIIEIWLAVKITLLVIRAFIRHPKSIWLWGFLAIMVIPLVVIGVIAVINHGQAVTDNVQSTIAGVCSALSMIGFLGLVVTSLVYHLKDTDTLMPEKSSSLVDAILHRSWLGEDTPLEEQEQVAA